MKQEHNLDLTKLKEFGPRTKDSYCIPGSNEIKQGVDFFFTDQLLLRFLTVRDFNIKLASELLLYQLEWRQTNVPIPYL